jgi:hypothetical protein
MERQEFPIVWAGIYKSSLRKEGGPLSGSVWQQALTAVYIASGLSGDIKVLPASQGC